MRLSAQALKFQYDGNQIMKKVLFLAVAIIAAQIPFTLHAQNEARLLRFPTIHGNAITFSYAGDLYTVDANGGIARCGAWGWW